MTVKTQRRKRNNAASAIHNLDMNAILGWSILYDEMKSGQTKWWQTQMESIMRTVLEDFNADLLIVPCEELLRFSPHPPC